MSRPRQGARLKLYGPDTQYGARRKAGLKSYYWYIRDGQSEIATGARRVEVKDAELALARHIQGVRADRATIKAPRGRAVTILDAMVAYAEDRGAIPSARLIVTAAEHVNRIVGDIQLADIDADTWKHYRRTRLNDVTRFGRPPGQDTVRGELGRIRAALNHVGAADTVTIPPPPPPRERHLSRSEVAAILRAIRARQQRQKFQRRVMHNMCLFVLLAVYTGARRNAILTLRWERHRFGGWIDLDNAQIDFRKQGLAQTTKRRGVAPIPRRLLTLLRGQRARSPGWVFSTPVGSAWTRPEEVWTEVVRGLGHHDLHMHDLSHTAVTWLCAAGVPDAYVAHITGKSPEVIARVYRHIMSGRLVEYANVKRGRIGEAPIIPR